MEPCPRQVDIPDRAPLTSRPCQIRLPQTGTLKGYRAKIGSRQTRKGPVSADNPENVEAATVEHASHELAVRKGGIVELAGYERTVEEDGALMHRCIEPRAPERALGKDAADVARFRHVEVDEQRAGMLLAGDMLAGPIGTRDCCISLWRWYAKFSISHEFFRSQFQLFWHCAWLSAMVGHPEKWFASFMPGLLSQIVRKLFDCLSYFDKLIPQSGGHLRLNPGTPSQIL